MPRTLERPDALGRQVGGERAPDDPVDRDRPPEAAVVGRAAVVAHAENVAPWDGDRARQIAALPAGTRGGERLALELAVADDVPVAHGDPVAADPDDPLDEGLLGLLGRRRRARLVVGLLGAAARRRLVGPRRRVEGDDVADLGIGAQAVAEAVDQHALTDVE